MSTFPEDPTTAIDGGEDGLALVRACLEVIGKHLEPGGAALLQVGPDDQAGRVAALAPSYGLTSVEGRSYERGAVVRLDRVQA